MLKGWTTDSYSVIADYFEVSNMTMFKGSNADYFEVGRIVEDCQEYMTMFNSICIQHVFREAKRCCLSFDTHY